MNNDIRESISRLGQIKTGDLAATSEELTTLLAALRKEIEAKTGVVNRSESTDPAYATAANDLVSLLQLSQAAVDASAEMDKLATVAGKAVSRVLKKAPK